MESVPPSTKLACVALRSKPVRHGSSVGCDKSAAVMQSYRNTSELEIMRKKGKAVTASPSPANMEGLWICVLSQFAGGGEKKINVYKQHWTNLKFLKEKNLGLTASLTEKVFTATNQKKDMERRDRELRCQITVNSGRQNKIINRDSALCWLKMAAGSIVYCLRSALSQ